MRTRAPRAVALWSAAVAVAAGTAILVASDLATLHRRASTFGPERAVVVAAQRLHLGTVLDRSDLRVRRVHASQLPPGVLARTRDVVGRVVTVPLVRGGFVADENLAPRARTGIDGALPVGTRAMRVTVDDALRPPRGAAIDILATTDIGLGPTDELDGLSSTVVAAGVQVLHVEAARESDGRSGLGVTVLVSPRQSRDLASAAARGVLTIALVPPEEARAP
ncbi:MAG: Flp pilus assembly protein CpaB [Acidimicrobiia bacterium]